MRQISGLTNEETAALHRVADSLIANRPRGYPEEDAIERAAVACALFCVVHTELCRLDFEGIAAADIGEQTGFYIELRQNINMEGAGSFKNPDYVPTYAFSRKGEKKSVSETMLNSPDSVIQILQLLASISSSPSNDSLPSNFEPAKQWPSFDPAGGEFGGAGASSSFDSGSSDSGSSDSSSSSSSGE